MQAERATGCPEDRVRTALAVTALALSPFAYFWRATLGEIVLLPHDGYRYSFPIKLLAARLIAAGELPLWNPYVFSGFPLFAEMQTGVLFPSVWIFCVLSPVAAANVQMIVTSSVAALGTYAYTRRIGCTRFGALFAGCTFAFGGFMVAHVGHVAMPQCDALLPWLLCALESLRTQVRLRPVAAGAAILALAEYAGYPPGPMYLLLVSALYTVSFGLIGRPPAGRARYVGACAAIVVIGLLLAAAQLVPAAELAAQSVRSHLSFEGFTEFSLPLQQLPMLAFPFLFGDQHPTPYWGAWNIWEVSGYVGIAPLMLAAAALPQIRRNRFAAFWVGLAGFALLLMLGPDAPLAWFMYHVPGYNLFRGQSRNVLELDFALAVLAALTLTVASRRALVAGAVAVAALVLGTACFTVTVGARVWARLAMARFGDSVGRQLVAGLTPANSAVWLPVAVAVAAAVAVVAIARRPSMSRCALLLALQLGDSWYFGDVLGREYPSPGWLLAPTELVQAVQGLPIDLGETRVALIRTSQEAIDLRPALWGVPMVNGYDPFLLSRYAQFGGGMAYWGQIAPAPAFRQPRFLDLLNTRWVVVMHPPPQRASDVLGVALDDPTRWSQRRATEEYTVLENRLARPRAWLVGRTVALAPDDALRTLREGRFPNGQPFDPSRIALIEAGPGTEYGPVDPGAAVSMVSYTPNAIELVTRSADPAFLVASEIDYPGWKAYVDGLPVPITRTDFILRGLAVGAGEHRVRMVFAPRSVMVGLGISALTAAALAVVGVARWRRRA